MQLHVEVKEQEENSTIEDWIENPSTNSITPTSQEMQQKHPNMTNDVTAQQYNLTVIHKVKALTW